MSALLDEYLRHYDGLRLGMTRRGLASALHASVGQSFVRAGGGYNLYRGEETIANIDWSAPAGAAGCAATTIRTFPGVAHDPQRRYVYALRAVGPGGAEEPVDVAAIDPDECAVVSFDGSGALVAPGAWPPHDVRVEPLSGGRFAVRWRGSPGGPRMREFQIYTDSGSGEINLAAPAAVISARPWQREYVWVSAPFADGLAVQWAVRAVNPAGQQPPAAQIVRARAALGAPPANQAVVVM